MKPEELMIGDWVNLYGDPIKINIDDLCLIDRDETYGKGVHCKPIPLTSEILEKNGFEKKVWWKYRESDVTTYAIGEGFYIEVSEDEFWLVDNCSDDGDYGFESNWICDIKHVHNLQHLLKDLEIEKEIVL